MQGLNRTKHPLPYPMPPFNAKVLKASYFFSACLKIIYASNYLLYFLKI